MASSPLVLISGRKRIADFGSIGESLEKQPRISLPYISRLDHSSDTSSHSGSDSEEDANEAGERTPLTPLSNRDWPSLRKTIKCTFPGCDKTFNRQAKLRDHLRYHTGERPFICTHAGCQSSFPRKTHLDRHVKSAHTDVRDYTCSHPGCGKAFSTGTRLRRHEASHEKRSQFKCDECGQEFRKHGTLQKHKDTEHRGLKAFICDSILENGSLCNAGFDRATALNSHKTRVHGPPRYECTICRSLTEDKNNSSSSSFPCFSTYSKLQSHNLSEHPPTCLDCGTICLTFKELNRHMELQHGVLPAPKDQAANDSLFVCPEEGCGRSFTKNGNLKFHIQSVHVQSRPFVCGSVDLSTLNGVAGWTGDGACFRSFKAKCQLEEHIRTAHMGLESRHKVRKQAKQMSDTSPKAAPSVGEREDAISRLTGTMYDQTPHRKIACLITGCSFLMTRDYDLDVHLRSRHGLDDEEIQTARANGMHAQFDHQHSEQERYDQASLAGGQEDSFWVGSSEAELYHAGDNDSWDVVQDEMDILIGEGHGWEDDIIIDPSIL